MGTASNRIKRVDHNRRSKIIAGAIEVINAEGIEGLTHRKVALAAGVPLASTTYYFESREEILLQTFKHAVFENLSVFSELLSAAVSRTDALEILAQQLHEDSSDERRPSARIVSELYTAAMRYPSLKPTALEWDEVWTSELRRWFTREEATMISAAFAGVIEKMLLEERQLGLAESRALLAIFN